MSKRLSHDRSNDDQEAQETEAAYPFPVELIDQLLAQAETKNAESITGENGLVGQLKKMLAVRMLSAESTRHLGSKGEAAKTIVTAAARGRS